MSYRKRLLLLAGVDSLLVFIAFVFSYMQLQPLIGTASYEDFFLILCILLVCYHIFAFCFHLYQNSLEYASVKELKAIFQAVTLSILAAGTIQQIAGWNFYGRSLLGTWMAMILFIGGLRFSWRLYLEYCLKPKLDMKKVLVVGAGQAGTLVARQLLNNPDLRLKPAVFIDDDPGKYKLHILGVPVAGTTADIVRAVEEHQIDQIVIAIPSLKKNEMNRIYAECSKTKIKTQILPKIEDVMLGKVSVNQFRDVGVEDLLGREPVQLDISGISETLSAKTVMVTGAGGSIGSEICRQVCKFSPLKIVLLGHGENSIYQIDMELRSQYGDKIEIVPVIGDIQDRDRMLEVMEEHGPNVVYHAAAHKHVPLMEYNPREAVKNNVLGTRNVAEAADMFGVGTFVLVSSDKAVNPTNVMGATKRIAEMVIQRMAEESRTKFVAVRFGNVLGSRGSVIPLFKKQIKAGGPVTVTHPDMTRYFMTIPEASRLVIQAGSLAKGGEVFVLDMGEPVKIVDLAKNLIELSGFSLEEIGLKYTGIRPGEKMFEELLNENEVNDVPVYPKILVGKSSLSNYDMVSYLMNNLHSLNESELKKYVISMVNNKAKQLSAVGK
ncbi:polysaccharide biosynthesis protein EpsC [Mesobacillus campisalis]|uniref:Polysaccharide biosynthesis protein EpsC n=1 Tax=Mesobacillus campisalis TaxID=1408103 RepID=A0A0M2SVW8_9BACI|nr:nucleoside-diphosphate sugar epimerase/dehydratase [Mesobacillus campisalis]KKK38714.1 polysaccharide biosynthesis protein EpsC [Mesobacillus campisalis]